MRTLPLIFFLFFCFAAHAAEQDMHRTVGFLTETMIQRVKADINSGNEFAYPLGNNALSVYALRTAGVPADDPAIRRALAFILSKTSANTYEEALVICALTATDPRKYADRIRFSVNFLIAVQDPEQGGFGYGVPRTRSDQSCSQYAILGLSSAEKAGFQIPPRVRAAAVKFFESTQNKDGGWPYVSGPSTFSMTCAGLSSLALLDKHLNTPVPHRCGSYKGENSMRAALNWINAAIGGFLPRFPYLQYGYYAGYGLERTAILNNIKEFNRIDWYRDGLSAILAALRAGNAPSAPYDNALALLFIARNSAPVAITKWAWNGEWNPDYYDVHNWVKHVSEVLDTPLDYQTASLKNDADLAKLARSSMLFVTGHGPFRASPKEVEFLKRFLDAGGLLVAEPCCGDNAFFQSFRKFMLTKFDPGNKVKAVKLSGDHPVYNARMNLTPEEFPVWQFKKSCGAYPVLLLGKDISCALNGDEVSPEKIDIAKKAAVNLLVYSLSRRAARGKLEEITLEAPKASDIAAFQVKKGDGSVYAFENPLGRVKFDGEWDSDPRFMAGYAKVFEHDPKIPVFDNLVAVNPETDDIFACSVLFFSGHGAPKLSSNAILNLRKYIENGGRILVEACCSDEAFQNGFSALMPILFPGRSLVRVEPDDPLYHAPFPLAGSVPDLTEPAKIKYPGGEWPPLYGLRGMNGEWELLYSPVDFSCTLQGDEDGTEAAYRGETAAKLAANLFQALLRKEEVK